MLDSPVALPYVPAAYLIANSLLTAPQLVSQFQDFRNYAHHAPIAPELVFERLASSLNELFNSAIEKERQEHAAALQERDEEHAAALRECEEKHAAALQECEEECRMYKLSNTKLKAELAELKGKTPEVKCQKPNPTIGVFHTNEVRPCYNPATKTSKIVPFTTPYSKAPSSLPMGLTLVDVSNDSSIRVRCSSSDYQNDRFKVHMDTWGDSTLFQGGCMWLEVVANDPDFQFGKFSTLEDHPWNEPKFNTTRQIFFQHAYSVPPRVVVWLNALDMDKSKHWRVKTYASNITPTGFTIHIDTWDDSLLYGAESTWVAYPTDRQKTLSGSFSTLQIRPVHPPQKNTSGCESFGNVFDVSPHIFAALNMLDVSSEYYLRVKVGTSVGRAGMTWNIETWDDSILYSAGASYIALG